jgi:hypothetical protein
LAPHSHMRPPNLPISNTKNQAYHSSVDCTPRFGGWWVLFNFEKKFDPNIIKSNS